MPFRKTERRRNNFRSRKIPSNYFLKVLYARLQTSKSSAENNLKIEVDLKDSEGVDSHDFRRLVSSLLYLAKQYRPDITLVTKVMSRFMSDPTVEHFNAGKRLLRCLQHTKSLRLFFSPTSNSTLVDETDAD